MNKLNIVLIMFGLLGIVYTQTCPSQCQCVRKKWDCGGKSITNEILLEIARSGDPSTAKELVLKKNNITYFPSDAFTLFTKLEILDLGENRLTKVPKDLSKNIPSLETLKLNENNLRELKRGDFVGYDNIKELNLFNNNIDELEPKTFQNFSKLTKLFAEGNNIKTLRKGVLNGLSQMVHLCFEGNNLEEIEAGVFYASPELEKLWLGKNSLTFLPEDLFKNLTRLYIVELGNNKFTDDSLPTGIFEDLHLDDLKLNENQFTTLKKDWFGKVSYTIDLSDNPMVCDCRIYQTYYMLHFGSKDIKYLGSCSNPSSFRNITIQKYFEDNLSNCTACSVNECQNNANCTVLDAKAFTYNCSCPRQFYGKYCEIEDFCIDAPCMNNGTCSNNLKTFTCQCEPGYIGDTCQLEQPCVLSNLCMNNGTCRYIDGTDYLCDCHVGYEGKICEKLIKEENTMKPGYIVLIVLVVLLCISIFGVCLYFRRKNKTDKGSEKREMSPIKSTLQT